MPRQITLSVIKGPLTGKEYYFGERTLCTVGRAHDCYFQFPVDAPHMNISRHHCLIDIDPPHVYVRDLGSRNGTYVNGVNIGQRPQAHVLDEAILLDLPRREVKADDEIRLGDTVFRVHIENPEPQPDEGPVLNLETHGEELAIGACI